MEGLGFCTQRPAGTTFGVFKTLQVSGKPQTNTENLVEAPLLYTNPHHICIFSKISWLYRRKRLLRRWGTSRSLAAPSLPSPPPSTPAPPLEPNPCPGSPIPCLKASPCAIKPLGTPSSWIMFLTAPMAHLPSTYG